MTRIANAPLGPLDRLGPSVVDQVRAIREELEEQAGHDLHRLADNARRAGDELRKRYPHSGAAKRK